MARPVTTLAIFFISMSLFTGAMQAQGIFATMGVGGVGQPCPDNPTDEQVKHIADCTVEDLAGQEGVNSGTSTGQTLFGMYNVLAGQVGGIYDVIYPGLTLLERAGVPGWITEGILGNLFSVMIIIALLSFLRGWSL